MTVLLITLGYLGHGFGAWLLVVCLLYPKLGIDTTDWHSNGNSFMYCLPMWLWVWPFGICNAIIVVIKIFGDHLYDYIQRRK